MQFSIYLDVIILTVNLSVFHLQIHKLEELAKWDVQEPHYLLLE